MTTGFTLMAEAELDNDIRISQKCRRILDIPEYSEEQSAALMGWLQSPNAAVADIAGRCLFALGPQAFGDLFLRVTASGEPWPAAVWTLGLFEAEHDRLLPIVRTWLAVSQGELERQCAVTLSQILILRKASNRWVDRADVEACRLVFGRDALSSLASQLCLRELQRTFHD